jgi:ankyrin repeat protein
VLLLAVEADDAEMVELLLESHADSNNVNELRRSALHSAASAGHVKVAKILLRHENINTN